MENKKLYGKMINEVISKRVSKIMGVQLKNRKEITPTNLSKVNPRIIKEANKRMGVKKHESTDEQLIRKFLNENQIPASNNNRKLTLYERFIKALEMSHEYGVEIGKNESK